MKKSFLRIEFSILLISFLGFPLGGFAQTTNSGCLDNPPEKNTLLFISNRPGGAKDNNWDLFSADLDGDNVERLTDFPDVSIRWFDKDPLRDRIVTAGSTENLAAQPSAPGIEEKIIAIIDQGQEPRILLDLRSGGHNPENFTALWHPTFSPDGQRIVFAASLPGESFNLWIMNDDGTNLRRILPDPQRTQNDPRFTPNGKVVYVRHEEEGLGQLLAPDLFDVWLIDPDRPENNQRLTTEPNIDGPPLLETDPAVSPNCRLVTMIRSAESFNPFRPFSSNAVMSTDGQASNFRLMQAGLNPDRTHGVPTWIDNETLLSYRWSRKFNGWRIIHFSINNADNDVEVINLDAPEGYHDLMPLAY